MGEKTTKGSEKGSVKTTVEAPDQIFVTTDAPVF